MNANQGQNLGLGSWPQRRARLSPHSIAWTFNGQDTSYQQVHNRVEQLATALHQLGIRRGDRIAYMGANHPALLETLFATSRIGAITVLINARLAASEVHYILTDCDARLLFAGPDQLKIFGLLAADELPALENVIAIEPSAHGEPRHHCNWPLHEYASFLQNPTPVLPHVAVSLDDPCLIMYTSGTTGRPKGAVLTHGNIFFNDMNVLIETDVRSDEVCLAAAPLFHIAGLNGLVLPVFLKGGRILITSQFRAELALELIEREKATSMFGVPAMLDALSQHPAFPDADFSQMRTLIVGGAPVPARILRLFVERGIDIQQGYGLTETAPAVLKLAAADAETKTGSAGKAQFLVDVQVVDLDGNPIQPGGTGEIITRGPNVFSGYWQREQATAEAFTDGWFRTGDLATIDDDGFVFLRDRSKDMYISGGENVYPSEVENALLDVPGVAEAAVIGTPDEKWGEIGCAFLVPAAGHQLDAEQILQALDGRLARYKLPRQIHVVNSLPRTATGKLQKHVLRQQEVQP